MDRIEIVGLWQIFINTTGKWEHYKFSFMDRNLQKMCDYKVSTVGLHSPGLSVW